MTRVDFFAVEPHFLDHLAPIWHAMPEDARGDFVLDQARAPFTPAILAAKAEALGVPAGTFGRERRPVVTAANGDMNRARDEGRDRIALLEHGTGQSFGADPDETVARAPSYPGGRNRGAASLFLSPNAHAAGRDAKAYPKARVEIIGCPKLDAAPERAIREPGARPRVALSFHWDCMVCAETRSGWREWKRILPFLAAEGRWEMIGHGHPRGIDEFVPHYRTHRFRIVRDFADVLREADVYVNEGSSTLYEAAAAGISVVVLNPSFFRLQLRHGLRFYEAADVGPNVRSRNSIDTSLARKTIAAIEEALANAPELQARREAALDVMYAYRSGAARRAADAILDWVGDRAAKAAA
jgi:hypothetical protein